MNDGRKGSEVIGGVILFDETLAKQNPAHAMSHG
jgi:fructose-bisphosphate aldolase class 1